MSDLDELARRVEEASSADRELDCAVAMAALGYVHDGKPEPYRRWQRMGADGDLGAIGTTSVMIRPYTSSLDAVVSLLERVLPLAEWEVATTGFRPSAAVIPNGSPHGASTASSPARALLAAVLRALSRTGEGVGS